MPRILIFLAFILSLQFDFGTKALADFTLVSWNAKHIGRAKQDLPRSAKLLKDGDMIAIQEVNSTKSGAEALGQLADNLQKLTGNKYCIGVSEIPSDSRERYGFLWKEGIIGYVTTKGDVLKTCSQFAVTIKLGSTQADNMIREPAVAIFMEIKTSKKFLLGTVHLVPTAKKPEREVPFAFRALDDIQSKLPRILVGDFNLSSDSYAFNEAKSNGYSPALPGNTKTSLSSTKRGFSKAYDNIFTKGIKSMEASVIDPFEGIPELNYKFIYNTISDHAPIRAKILTN